MKKLIFFIIIAIVTCVAGFNFFNNENDIETQTTTSAGEINKSEATTAVVTVAHHTGEDKEDELRNSISEEIFNAINVKDKEKIKSMFSQKTIAEADDIDAQIDELLNFIDGKISDYEMIPLEVYTHQSGWKIIEKSYSWKCIVSTDSNSYLFFFETYEYKQPNDNNGVFCVEVMKKDFDYPSKYGLEPGIVVWNDNKTNRD